MQEIVLSIALGIGLSAACGFRIFVPFLVMSVAARSGHLSLAPSFAWIAGDPALVAFAVATVLEIAAYYVPWLDNALDIVATPAAIVAGAVATAAVITDMSPWLRWTLAVIAGGGAAGAVQTATVLLRGASSVTTMGLGNFAVASAELIGATATALFSLMIPLVVLMLVVILVVLVLHRVARDHRGRYDLLPERTETNIGGTY